MVAKMTIPDTSQMLQVLTADDVVARLQGVAGAPAGAHFAFYSSQLERIVTDPSLMVLPFDDHMVHRGHGIFDTAGLVNGKLYDLDAHLDRFQLSADRSKLRLPASRADLREIILKTAAVSGKRDGSIRTGFRPDPAASS